MAKDKAEKALAPSRASPEPGPSALTGSTLIKSLKSAQDPPTPAGPTKIEIAAAAWADASLVVPRKADVLRDWIVEAWSRVKPGPRNPILAAPYHRLLVAVSPFCAAPAAAPLSLLGTYISSCRLSSGAAFDLALLPGAAAAAFGLLFTDTKAEAWAEQWALLVSALAALPAGSDAAAALVPAADMICGALAASLPASPNAKKIAAGLHAALPAYARAAAHGLPQLEGLAPQLLFPVQALQTVDPIKALLGPLAASPAAEDVGPALALLPHLFEAFVAATLTHRYTLYGKASADRPVDVVVADRVRGAVIGALGACLELVSRVEDSAAGAAVLGAVWAARLRLWRALGSWGGYLETEPCAGELVAAEATRAAAALNAYGATEADAADEGLAGAILRTLDALERLDHARAALDTVVVGWCLAAPARTHAAAAALLGSLLRFHQLTHSLSSFVDLLADAAAGLFDPALPAAALEAVYTLVACGPLSDRRVTDALAAAVRGTNLAGRRGPQWAGMLDDIGRRVRAALCASEESAGSKRKRARVADAPARLVAVLSRVAAVLLSAGARATPGDDDVEYAVGALARAFVPEEDDDDEADKKKKKKHSNLSADIVSAARLRVARAASLVADVETNTPVSVALGATQASAELGLAAFRSLLTYLALSAHADDGSTSRAQAVDAVLTLLSSGTAAWSGRDASVSPASLAAACWTILGQTGVAVLDATASAPQLDRLAALLLSLVGSSNTDELSTGAAVARVLRTTDTWELVSLRSALLRALALGTEGTGTFAVLSSAPAAWLSKGARGALLDAAYAAKDKADKAPIRAWLARLAATGILGPLDVPKLEKVLKKADGAEEQTLALARAAMPHLVRSSLPALLDMAIASVGKDKKTGDVRARAVPLLLATLASQGVDKLSAERDKLEQLEAAARKALAPRVDAVLANVTEDALPTLEAYRTLTAYARWLGHADSSRVGARLVSLRHPAFAVPALDLVPRSSTLAAYLLLSEGAPSPALDDAFKAYARTLSADSYAAALAALVPRTRAENDTQKAAALRAARILVSAPVEGSGRALVGHLPALLAAEGALPEALGLINAVVDDRTGLLRATDAAQILATLTAALLPSSTPPPPSAGTAHPALLAAIIAPMHTLARHRPDLLLAHLPAVVGALAAVFPLLLRATRAGRARLARTRPSWLPLAADGDADAEASAELLSRTLIALCTARTSPTTGHKALAGPLGKHAPALLVAYARAAADPWAVLAPQVRRALEPGLWALCDVVTAGGRADGRGREGEGVGAPFGLARDEAQREVWAGMWGAWGRRRYTGLG